MPAICSAIHWKSLMMFDALTTSMKCSSASLYVSTSSTNVPCGVVSAEYWIWWTASFAASFEVMCWTAASASPPAISISPMWLTSNSPARVRTAMCSSPMPEYSTGMSQPPNSTIRAAKRAMARVERSFLERAGRRLGHQQWIDPDTCGRR